MDIVYIETTVVGNIAGRMHPNPDVASRQRITRDWCYSRRPKMIPDPNDEILSIKRRLAAKFDNDVHRIAADIRQRQDESGHEVISLPPRRCMPTTTNNVVNRSGESDGN